MTTHDLAVPSAENKFPHCTGSDSHKAGFGSRLIPDGRHPVIKPLGKRRTIGAGPEMGMGGAPPGGQWDSDAVKAPRCEPGTDSENALAPNTTPSLATALEPGVDDHCVRRLDSTAAHGAHASRVSRKRIRWRWLRTDPMAVVISPAPGLFCLRYRNASITVPTPWGSSVRMALREGSAG